MANTINKAMEKGVKFLAREQRRDGSFFCLVSTKLDDYSNTKTVPAIVPTNFVLSSLIHIKNPVADLPADLRFAGGFGKARTLAQAGRIKKKAANFLLKERGEYWSFNYWFRKSDWYKKEPYPDDTDDTFVPLAALYEYKPELFDGEAMARITTMLTSAEKQEGGPYDMWLVPPDARDKWNDTDLVCNANIAYFLSLQDIYLPKVTAFIEKKIENKGYEFPYNKIYPAIYFISRSYRGKKTEKMTRLLLRNQEKDGKWENPLRTALAISALINFYPYAKNFSVEISGEKYRERLERGIRYLLKTQESGGSWKPYSFYFQMRKKNKTLYAGSASITTALCLEAINKFNKIKNQKSKVKITPKESQSDPTGQATQNSKINKDKSGEKIYKKVVKIVQERFSAIGEDLKKEAEDAISKTLKGDNGKQIVLLPFLFRESLRLSSAQALGEKGKIVPDDLVTQLGAANVFGWMAYTIYDDFLDEEGDPKLLSVANVALRESAEIFSSALPAHTRFATFAKNIFDTIDNANTWEIAHCRFNPHQQHPYKLENVRMYAHRLISDYGDYSQLANKSLGHALGPAAILFALGYNKDSAEVLGTIKFFKNYIIACQLNDDAHDWEDDLKRGQVNAVGARLLRDTKSGSRDPEKGREVFWRKTIIGACKDISRHIGLAKNDLKKLSIIKEPAVFADLLAAIEYSVEKALKERDETIKFLKTYTSYGITKSN